MKPGTVYIVEDEAMIAMQLCDQLRSLDYQIAGWAATGEEALPAIAQTQPDVVLLDIQLAGTLTGIDVAHAVRQEQPLAAIVFLTAFSHHDVLVRARTLEPEGFLIKPFDLDELHASLQMARFKKVAEYRRQAQSANAQRAAAHQAELQKERSLTRMAGAVAQSLSNSLGTVLGLVELARDLRADARLCDELLADAAGEIRRAAELSRALRQYAGGATADVQIFDVGDLCRRSADALAGLLPKRLALTMKIAPCAILVQANPETIYESIELLVMTAANAMVERGGEVELCVCTDGAGLAATGRIWPSEWNPGSMAWTCVSVRDRGVEIAAEMLDYIFDPFFAAPADGGHLGLALVFSVARGLGGAVGVDTGPTGTAYRLLLPTYLVQVATEEGQS